MIVSPKISAFLIMEKKSIIDSIFYENIYDKNRKFTQFEGTQVTIGLGSNRNLKLIEGLGSEYSYNFGNHCLFYLFSFCEGSFNDCQITFPVIPPKSGYQKYIQKDKYWFYVKTDTLTGNYDYTFVHRFGKDTTIKNIKYTELLRSKLNSITPPHSIVSEKRVAFLREDTIAKKVYCLPVDFSKDFYSKNEHLIFDFDTKKGDSLILSNLYTIKLNSQKYVDSFSTSNSNRNTIYKNTGLILEEGWGFQQIMSIYYEKNIFFRNTCQDLINRCNIFTSSKDIESKSVFIYPNPASNTVFLPKDIDIESSIIYAIDGKKMISTSLKAEIDISNFEKGMYFITILDKNQKQFYGKFVKN